MLQIAIAASKAAEAKATRLASARWTSWLSEGPSKGLRRQHQLPRVSSGWIRSQVGIGEANCISDTDDTNGLNEGEVRRLLEASCRQTAPLCAQETVQAELQKWSKE